ncbi:MAG: hypothetical protein DRJ03_01440 [Chloroflexi bacterium]|nr:MAG: hypothetical protein DRJ03_01440 [Chloroflexota bacterium]
MIVEDIYRIAKKSAKSAAARGCYAICDSDLDDMIQNAAIAIWQSKPGMSNAYYFVAGKRSASAWLIWWKYGATRDKLRGMLDEIETPINISAIERWEEVIANVRPHQKSGLSLQQQEVLHNIFWQTRRKHGSKEIAGIRRDIAICNGLVRGDTTAGIAQEIGLTMQKINRYRQDIRKRLEKYINEKANCSTTCQNQTA